MPRPPTRSTRSINNRPPSPLPQPPTPEEGAYLTNLSLLRRNWKWAVFSQFYFTFAPLFAMDDVPISAVEDDLARCTRIHTPRVMHRLLYALTQDRKITTDNWQSCLRRQYARRDPSSNPIGFEPKKVNQKYIVELEDPQLSASASVEPEQFDSRPISEDKTQRQPEGDPDDGSPLGTDLALAPEASPEASPELKDWHDLPMLSKLDSINLLVEWMFHNPHRIRSIMKDDDETARWRIEPIGYDVKRNAYWLIGADRLWVQRSTQKPKNLKRKRLPAPRRPAVKDVRKPGGKRRKVLRDDSSDSSGGVSEPQPREIVAPGPRAAKLKANKKLDAQARALAEFQRESALAARSTRATRLCRSDKNPEPSPSRPFRATRVNGRLRRGKADPDEEWQSVPDEWLTEDNSEPLPKRSTRAVKPRKMSPETTDSETDPHHPRPIKTGLESDGSVSDLTDLSSDREGCLHGGSTSAEDNDGNTSKSNGGVATGNEPDDNPGEFIEWEMICSTLPEWEHIAERFEDASNYSEKALYRLLKNDIVPAVVTALQELDRKKQEAERKRILEEAVTHRKRSSRIAMKESEKEVARLLSRRKAEETEKLSRAQRLEMRQKREEVERERREREQKRRDGGPRTRANAGGRHRESRETSTASTSRVSNDQQSDWELNCEVCLKRTRNQDDGIPIMCCGLCNIWQHIPCHEERDRQDGLPPRDWEREEFYCSRCRPANGHGTRRTQPFHTPQHARAQLRWDHGRSGAKLPVPTQSSYTGLPVERHGYYQVPPASGATNGGHSHPHPTYGDHSSSLPTSVDQYSNISFSHYQPHQRGFTSRHAQSPIYNSTHYPNTHYPHPQPAHNISPIYPTYTNGTGNPTFQGHNSQPSLGGHYRTSAASALPLQNGSCTTQSWSFPTSNVPGGTHVTNPVTYEVGYDPRAYQPPRQAVQSQYVPVMGPGHPSMNTADGPHNV